MPLQGFLSFDLNNRGLLNYLLLPLSAIFYLGSKLRLLLFKTALLRRYTPEIPLIVVGNISVGGTGKTPIVIALVQYFKQQGKRVGVVSRGYAGAHKNTSLLVNQHTDASQSGDEPLLIALQTQVAVMVNKNRVHAVQDLISKFALDLLISDDGLQHYAMGRTVEIAVIDGIDKFGNGFYLPAGPLREPIKRLESVDFVIHNGEPIAGQITSKLIAKYFVNIASGAQKPLDFFADKNCNAVAAISHPQRFFDTLTALKIKLKPRFFPDHYAYTAKNLNFNNDNPLLMTAKDYVKCKAFATDNMWYLSVEADLSEDFLTQLTSKL